jgi:hypothetical protein
MKEQPIKIGYIHHEHENKSDPVFVEIRETDTGFNITGNIRSHSYGQINTSIKTAIKENKFEYLLPKKEIRHLLDFWNKYHLNDMKSGCPHQEEEIKILKKTQPELFENYDYLKIKQALSNGGHCHICNYEHGHGWRTELPPAKELKWIREFKARYEGVKLGRRIQ